MSDEPKLCDICNKPMVYDGDTAFYMGVRHWDCQYPNGYRTNEEIFADANAALDRANAALAKLKRMLK